MFEFQKSQVENYRQNRKQTVIFWSIVHVAISVPVILYVPYGVLLILGYLLYSNQSNSTLQFLNVEETNLTLNMIVAEKNEEIRELKERIDWLESQAE